MNQKTPKIGEYLCCFIFVGMLLAGMVSFFYLLGMHLRKEPVRLALHAVYDHPTYQQLFTTLDKEDYHVLHSKQDSDVVRMLEAYAMSRNYRIVDRHYNYSPVEKAIYKYSLILSTIIIKHFNQKSYKPTLWVLHIEKGKFPKDDIRQIFVNEPNHKIIVLTEKQKLKTMKGFTEIKEIPSVSWNKQLETIFHIPKQLSSLYPSIYSVNELFEKINSNSISPEKHLQDYYIPLPKMKKQVKKIVKNLCEKGKAKTSNPSKSVVKVLESIGVLVQNNRAYWASDYYRMNYILQKQKICKPGIVPTKVQSRAEKLRISLLSKQHLATTPSPPIEPEHKQIQEQSCECKCDCGKRVVNQSIKRDTPDKDEEERKIITENSENLTLQNFSSAEESKESNQLQVDQEKNRLKEKQIILQETQIDIQANQIHNISNSTNEQNVWNVDEGQQNQKIQMEINKFEKDMRDQKFKIDEQNFNIFRPINPVEVKKQEKEYAKIQSNTDLSINQKDDEISLQNKKEFVEQL